MSKKYTEYNQLNLTKIAQEVLSQWEKEKTFDQSLKLREGSPNFIFYEGPPSANGQPGIHHVMSRAIKDIFCRYKTQKGFYVKRKAGWDTHGLPVELGVEKKLGITKEDIGKKISVDEYNKACRTEVMKYKDMWDDLTVKMGYWVNLSDPYITFKNEYIESLWYLLSQIYEKGLLYKGYTIQPYSPAAGTGLSSHELNMPGCYRDVKDTTCVAMFRLTPTPSFGGEASAERNYEHIQKLADVNPLSFGEGWGEAYFLAWTTTPWTLPSNTALAVGKNIDYVLIKTFNPYSGTPVLVIMAKALISSVFGKNYFETDKNFSFDLFPKYWSKLKDDDKEILDGGGRKLRLEVFLGKSLSFDEYDVLEKIVMNHKTVIKETLKLNLKSLNISEIEYKKLIDNHIFHSSKTVLFPYKILAETKGENLVGLQYEQLIPWVNPGEGAFRVIAGDYVTTEDGTGIVHIAPTFGADDDRVAKQAGVPPLFMYDKEGKRQPMVDRSGKFFAIEDLDSDFVKNAVNIELYKEFAGRFVKNEYASPDPSKGGELGVGEGLDVDLSVMLKLANKAFKIEKYTHNYPHCWRTDKPILYYPLDSWFIRTTAIKDRMIELNKTINWKPEATGTGRFGNWLENLVDWNLSRSRYWGTPLPIWRTEDGSEEICIGSVEQLRKEVDKAIVAGFMKENPYKSEDYNSFDLHRPYIDNVFLVSPTGKKMMRETDLIDVWFDSGAMPYAQYFYPKNEIRDSFPADFIAEGVDQTRGWFFTLHTIATLISDSAAFKTVVSNGLVLDKNGNKMSKRLGNAVDPFEILAKYGPDATRWYLLTNSQPWDNLKFDSEGIDEMRRKFFGTLYNTYGFFALYANIDGFAYKEADIAMEKRPEIDRWILSELNSLIAYVDSCYADYEPTKAGRAMQNFVDECLSNWYVRLCRRRFWKGNYSKDKISAYQTLYTCLEVFAQLMAPIAPFFADRLFCDLNAVSQRYAVNSVHLTDFPKIQPNYIDKDLENRMLMARQISSMALSLRKRNNIRVRQPLAKIMIPIMDVHTQNQIEAVKDLILSEVNIKAIEYFTPENNVLVKKIKPNFKTLGPKYGKIMKAIAATINEFTQEDISALEKEEKYCFSVEGENVELLLSDVEIFTQDIPGWIVANEGNMTVALDITITKELAEEGLARELVNRIQNFRKESNLDVIDRIKIRLQYHPDLEAMLRGFKEYICNETLCDSLELMETITDVNKVQIDIIEGLNTDAVIVKQEVSM